MRTRNAQIPFLQMFSAEGAYHASAVGGPISIIGAGSTFTAGILFPSL